MHPDPSRGLCFLPGTDKMQIIFRKTGQILGQIPGKTLRPAILSKAREDQGNFIRDNYIPPTDSLYEFNSNKHVTKHHN